MVMPRLAITLRTCRNALTSVLHADYSGVMTNIQQNAKLKIRNPDEGFIARLCLETGDVHQQVKEVIIFGGGHSLARTLFSWLKSEMGSYARTEITDLNR